ncbi:3-oxoacyl-[acyl-carrier protein] reductase [Lentzea xinjiangensis]|uniref:3-oxoacyl-[acyl-carrier protein] reductase n=1 Tax=Lentzea xinjiangensis TaxID=402600 RepID=A0A1H9J7J3_9PSEU|nr:SDR family oxidoreductase [Lentzea xinjiangensis]SEQ82752.1 3-oxoacyl-[acyl-carrier protein] reductase [Lentzea xinjiangensis]
MTAVGSPLATVQHLAGRTALITGGSRGIGAAVARRLARHGSGVAVTWTSSPAAADELVADINGGGGRAVAIRADNGDAGQVQAAVSRVVEEFGGLDVLVNNAGIGMFAATERLSLDDFDRMVAVNVRGVFAAVQAALRHMGPGSRIITTGSVFADRNPFPEMAVYGMTKAALAGLSRGWARELAPRGITVNVVQPGAVDTETNPAAGLAARTMLPATPVGRYGTADEIAGLIAYLASPEAAFITGSTINADGGFTT